MNEVGVTANGIRIVGWTGVTIRRSMDQVADEFSLELVNQNVQGVGGLGVFAQPTRSSRSAADVISNAAAVVIDIDEQPIVTGYLDDYTMDHDAQRSSMRVGGRSKAGDLCDCAAEKTGGIWKKATLQEIARDLCLPFGITVSDPDGLSGKAFERFRLEPGESVYEAVTRAADLRQALVLSDEFGDLYIARANADAPVDMLELGVNIISASYQKTLRDRYSVYKFKGQTEASDDWNGTKTTKLKGSAEDSAVERYRPYLVNNLKQKSNEDLGKRAAWERNVRAGRSIRYRCTVPEWTSAVGGKPWAPNTIVRVKDAWAGIDEDMLLCSVEFQLTPQQRVAHLELVDPCTYDQNPKAKLPKLADSSEFAGATTTGNLFSVGVAPPQGRPWVTRKG